MRLTKLYSSTHLLTEECFEDPRITHPEDVKLRDLLRSLRTFPTPSTVSIEPIVKALVSLKDPCLRALFVHGLRRSAVFHGHPFNATRLRSFLQHIPSGDLPYEFTVLMKISTSDHFDTFSLYRIAERCVREGPRDIPKYANWVVTLGFSLAIEGRLAWLEQHLGSFTPLRYDETFFKTGMTLNRFINAVECGRLDEALRIERDPILGSLKPAARELFEIHRQRLTALLDPGDPVVVPENTGTLLKANRTLNRALQCLLTGHPHEAKDFIKEAARCHLSDILHLAIVLSMGDRERTRRIAATFRPFPHDHGSRVIKSRALWLIGDREGSDREFEGALRGALAMGALESLRLWCRLCGHQGTGQLSRTLDRIGPTQDVPGISTALWPENLDLMNPGDFTSILFDTLPPRDDLVGDGLEGTRRQITKLSKIGDGILLEGESGCGKSHIARLIHLKSGGGPLLTVSCSGIAGDLMASELFGHTRGAFTGAISERRGIFEEAGEGTVLLDDLQDMPPPMQAALLSVLESRHVRPVGASSPRPIRCRILAATTKPLAGLAASGIFRDDLRHRLEKFVLRIPPLRDRSGDIAALLHHFLGGLGIPRDAVDKAQWGAWCKSPWPGNVRELKNAVERWALLSYGETMKDASEVATGDPVAAPLEAALRRLKEGRTGQTSRRRLLLTLLEKEGPLAPKELARALGVTVQTVLRDLKVMKGSVRKREHSHLYEAPTPLA